MSPRDGCSRDNDDVFRGGSVEDRGAAFPDDDVTVDDDDDVALN